MMKGIFVKLVLAAFAVAGLSFSNVNAEDKIVIEGSSTVGPIAKGFAEYYMKKNKGVNITVNESGSGNGAKALISKKCDIATMSRAMKQKEIDAAKGKGRNPIQHVVGIDGLAIVVHPSNPVKNLTIQQIHDIYGGKIKNWKEVGGPDLPIVIISRDTSSGTYETFNKLVMKKDKISDTAEYVGSNGAARSRVQTTKPAIGYVGIGFLDKTLKAVTVNNVAVNERNILAKKYPIARDLYMYTDGEPAGVIKEFIGLANTPDGKAIVKRIGFIAVQ